MHGQTLNHFRANREPYEEDYSLEKDDLLKRAIAQVRNEFLVRSVFFVEDTSIRIEALSGEEDFPGLRAKEWFADTTFYQLDSALNATGANRRATVKSDIALHIPNLEETFLFHGEVSGVVADRLLTFEADLQHPWLTPDTFNGWLIPDGASVPLGAMNFQQSLEYDFRGKSLNKLLDFLRPLNAAANLPSTFFSRERGSAQRNYLEPYLPHVFDPTEDDIPAVICAIGHKCAGKTTASEFIQSDYGATFFEASEQLRATARDLGLEIKSSVAASRFLEENGQDVVAQQVIDQLSSDAPPLAVISGLRTVEELDLICSSYKNVKILEVVADRRIRFERHIRRGRDSDVKTADQFSVLDREQMSFGLLQVAGEVADFSIVNEGDLPGYYMKINAAVREALLSRQTQPARSFHLLSELHRCLIALSRLSKVSSCEEISSVTDELGGMVWRYNTNRALKDVPLFVDRFDRGEELLSYQLNGRGQRLLSLLNRSKGFNILGVS